MSNQITGGIALDGPAFIAGMSQEEFPSKPGNPLFQPVKKTLFIFPNGMVAAFVNGQQVPELQARSVQQLWAEHAEREGHDPTGFTVETDRGIIGRIDRDADGKAYFRFK